MNQYLCFNMVLVLCFWLNAIQYCYSDDSLKCSVIDAAADKCGNMIDPKKGPVDDGYSPSTKKINHVIRLIAKSQAGKDIISFRARPPSKDPDNYAKSLVGHIFMYLGKELPDGTTVYYMVAGFYPDKTGNDKVPIYSSIIGPGHVEYEFSDMASSVSYDTYVSEQQARMIEQIAEKWDNKNYNLFDQNCTNMIKDVASYLGLKLGNENSSLEFPTNVVEGLARLNNKYSAIEHLQGEAKRGEAVIEEGRKDHFKHFKNGVDQSHHVPGRPGAADNSTVWRIPQSMQPGGSGASGARGGDGSGVRDGPSGDSIDWRMKYEPRQYPTGGVTVCTSDKFACL